MHEDHINGGYGAGTIVWQLTPSNFTDAEGFSIHLDHPEHKSTGNLIRNVGIKVATRIASSFHEGVAILGWVKTIMRDRVRAFMGNRFWNQHIYATEESGVAVAYSKTSSNATNATKASTASSTEGTVASG